MSKSANDIIYSNLISYQVLNNSNIGIGKINPSFKLDVNGDINFTSNLKLNGCNLPFSFYTNTNVIASNALFSYINNCNNYAYYQFLIDGSMRFPQTTSCDLICVGAGGNGGLGSYSGGGGAGEVIVYPNFNFNSNINYNIQVGLSSFNSNLRISKITSNNIDVIRARGGGDGYNSNIIINNYITNNIAGTNDYYYSFTTTGTSTITFDKSYTCDILVVGGGGAGAGGNLGVAPNDSLGGGGGAGGLVYVTDQILTSGVYTINVGRGGDPVGATPYVITTANNNGGNSSINGPNGFQLTAIGGGHAIGQSSAYNTSGNKIANAGGSGGGGARNANTGGATTQQTATTGLSSTFGYGNIGGNGTDNSIFGAGGGGGAGSAGQNGSTTKGGNGGDGMSINITGTATYYAGGGGGAAGATSSGGSGTGGLGGGGNAKTDPADDNLNQNGINGTGGGGGGTGNGGSYLKTAGSGGSGIVIIRFKNITNTSGSGGSGGGGSGGKSISTGGSIGTSLHPGYSNMTTGKDGTSIKGGDGGSATAGGGYVEGITSNSYLLGEGGKGASINGSTTTPARKTRYGEGGDGGGSSGGIGARGVVIIKYPLLLDTSSQTNIQTNQFELMNLNKLTNNVNITGNLILDGTFGIGSTTNPNFKIDTDGSVIAKDISGDGLIVKDVNATNLSTTNLTIGTIQVIDSSRNISGASLTIGSTSVIDSSRNIANVGSISGTSLSVEQLTLAGKQITNFNDIGVGFKSSGSSNIFTNSNIGIGTTNPLALLDVNGTIKSTVILLMEI